MQSGSEKLNEAINAINALAERKEVGPRIKEELSELTESLAPVRDRVREIEGLYALDFRDVVDTKIGAAMQLWGEVAPGVIRGTQLQAIRSASPLLSTLYLNGLDIEKAYKFGPVESELSSWFGSNIDKASGLLRALRREKRSEEVEAEWSTLVPLTRDLGSILNMLAEKNVVRGKKVLVKNKEGRWSPFKFEWFRDDPKSNVLVVYEKKNPALVHMLQGEWLNCYVHDIIDNQLGRHDIPFELYTQVVYKAPADVIRSKSDFDVIGRFRDTVICVECKSGRLDANRGDFEHIVQRTEDLRHVLSSMGTGDVNFLFFVVYDPEINSEEEMIGQLQAHDILPLRTNQVRSVMAKTLASAIS